MQLPAKEPFTLIPRARGSPGRDLLVSVLWPVLVLLVSVTIIAAVPLRYRQLDTVRTGADVVAGQLTPSDAAALGELGLTPALYSSVITGLEATAAVFMLLVGAVIFWRRSNNPAVPLFAFTLVTLGIITSPLVNALQQSQPYWDVIVTLIRLAGLASLVITFLSFPDGRFIPAWSRWLAALWLLYLLLSLFVPSLRFTSSLIITSSRQAALLGWALSWISFLALIQVYRYRYRATTEQRQQTKWVVYGLFVAFGISTIVSLPLILVPSLRESSALAMAARIAAVAVVLVGQLFFSITVAIAIFRYRLYDIDLIINRTLVYGLLTSSLILIYFFSIILFQSLLPVQSEIATVFSTLAVASAFAPLRTRIQSLIDRRFFRRKYDAAITLSRFAISARDEVNLDVLSAELVNAIAETVQPANVSLWLAQTDQSVNRGSSIQR